MRVINDATRPQPLKVLLILSFSCLAANQIPVQQADCISQAFRIQFHWRGIWRLKHSEKVALWNSQRTLLILSQQ